MHTERVRLFASFKEVETLSNKEKQEYYLRLRRFCYGKHFFSITCKRIIALISPHLRNFELEIRGTENLDIDSNAVFVCNHSNSHDFFTTEEVFSRIKRSITPLGAWDGLNFFSRLLFALGDVTFFKRDEKESTERGMLKLCSKILAGRDAIIFAEATWNLHPIKPMLEIKAGSVFVALVTGKPIIPVIYEYVEKRYICEREKDLYSKCIVTFGKPIECSAEESIFDITAKLQKQMENMRHSLWVELGIIRDSLNDINTDVYLNHLDLKKNKAFGYKYITERESLFLLNRGKETENEYWIDEKGNFVPLLLKE